MDNHKYRELIRLLEKLDGVAVAFSGGVDSTFLLYAAKEALGDRVVAAIGKSPIHARWEHEEAVAFAEHLGVRVRVLETEEMQNAEFLQNPENRCYICKKAIMGTLLKVAKQEGFNHVVEGSNKDDLGDFRPGMDALRELGIDSPLLEVGLGKQEIRGLSKMLELPTWNRPSMACLASRIPYGSPITTSKLDRIEKTERAIAKLGFSQLRVRDHGDIARIEVEPKDIPKIATDSLRLSIIEAGRSAGYIYVCLDLQGYRTGALNEVLKNKT